MAARQPVVAWRDVRAYWRKVGVRPRTLRDLFPLSLDVLDTSLAIAAASLSATDEPEGAAGQQGKASTSAPAAIAYRTAEEDARKAQEGAVPLFDSRRVFTWLLPSCIALARCRRLVLEGQLREAETAVEDALWRTRTSLASARGWYLALGTASTIEDPADFLRPDTRAALADDEDSDRWWDFIPPNHPIAVANSEWLNVSTEPYEFRSAPDAVVLLQVATVQMASVPHLLFDSEGDPYEIAAAHSPGGPWDFAALARACELWEVESASSLLRLVATFRFLEEPPNDLATGRAVAERLLKDGRLEEAIRLLAHLRADAYAFGSETDRVEHLVWASTVRARVAKERGDPAGALTILTENLDALPLREALTFHLRQSETRDLVAHLAAYLEGWRDAVASVEKAQSDKLDRLIEMVGQAEHQRTHTAHGDSNLAEAVKALHKEVEAVGELLGGLPEEISARLRSDWKTESEYVDAQRTLLRGWYGSGESERQDWPRRVSAELMGKAAWERLDEESRNDLVFGHLLKQAWGDQRPAGPAWAFCRAFERELRRALARGGVFGKGEIDRAPLGSLLETALGSQGRPRAVALQADELKVRQLRNKAVHPAQFKPADLRALEHALFHDGDNQKGLLAMIATG